MQLAELAVAKSVVATDLTGLTIEGAIKRLAAPKPPIETARPAPPKLKNTKGCGSTAKLNSLLWADASIDARRNFVSAVGLDAWLEAIPAEWLPLIERRLFQQHQPPATISRQLPADLSIPQYLRRTPGTNETNTVSASEVAAQVGEPANKATDTTRRAKTPPIPIVPRPATLEARS